MSLHNVAQLKKLHAMSSMNKGHHLVKPIKAGAHGKPATGQAMAGAPPAGQAPIDSQQPGYPVGNEAPNPDNEPGEKC